MIIKLSVCNDDKNIINKTLIDVVEINIKLRSDFDILNPKLIVKGDYEDYNYIQIDDLNRNYFIDSFDKISSDLIRLNCSSDLLETYKDDILNSDSTYSKMLASGDYGDITLNKTGVTLIDEYESDVVFEYGDNTIFSVMRGD